MKGLVKYVWINLFHPGHASHNDAISALAFSQPVLSASKLTDFLCLGFVGAWSAKGDDAVRRAVQDDVLLPGHRLRHDLHRRVLPQAVRRPRDGGLPIFRGPSHSNLCNILGLANSYQNRQFLCCCHWPTWAKISWHAYKTQPSCEPDSPDHFLPGFNEGFPQIP